MIVTLPLEDDTGAAATGIFIIVTLVPLFIADAPAKDACLLFSATGLLGTIFPFCVAVVPPFATSATLGVDSVLAPNVAFFGATAGELIRVLFPLNTAVPVLFVTVGMLTAAAFLTLFVVTEGICLVGATAVEPSLVDVLVAEIVVLTEAVVATRFSLMEVVGDIFTGLLNLLCSTVPVLVAAGGV